MNNLNRNNFPRSLIARANNGDEITVQMWNAIVDAINQMRGVGAAPQQVLASGGNSGGDGVQGPQGESGTSSLYQIIGQANNYLGVQAWGSQGAYGPQLYAAKPDLLQHVSSRDGDTFVYFNGFQCNITQGSTTLPFKINPTYAVGDKITCEQVPYTGVQDPFGNPITLQDSNANGRQWATDGNVVSGLQGPAGNAGLDGSDGVQGFQGVSGVQGATGSSGTQGFTGVQGVAGPQGATGAGVQGVAGSNGSTGATGVQGVQGSSGGFQGAQGPQGSSSGGGSGTGPQAATILALGASYLGIQFLDATGTGQGPQQTCARQYLNRPLSSWNGITYSGYLANGCQRTATNSTTENEFLTPPPVVGDEILVATVLWGGATGITYIDLTSRIWATQ